jgi:Lon-like protease
LEGDVEVSYLSKNQYMKQSLWLISMIIIFIILTFIKLPYYVTQPGEAQVLEEMIEVKNGYEEKGAFMLTTVRVGEANIVQYLFASLNEYHHLIPLNHIRRPDENEDEYHKRQLQMMSGSQEAAKIVAYERAGKSVEVTYEGVIVTGLISGMPASEQLKLGDIIIEADGLEVKKAETLIDYLKNKKEGEKVYVVVERGNEKLEKVITVALFPSTYQTIPEDKVGVGITTLTKRHIITNPKVDFAANSIGGPSAGLMFTLEIFNQLTKTDWTKGYKIAGTGEIQEDGSVGSIGGIQQKVVAADESEADIFFAPVENKNYEEALEAAQDIDTKMKVVPIETFDDALEYLKQLSIKQGA